MGDNGKLCAMEPCLQLKRFLPQTGPKLETLKSAGQHLTYRDVSMISSYQ